MKKLPNNPPPTFRGVHLPSYRGFVMRKPPTFCQDMWKCLHREVSVLWDIFLEEVLLYTALWMRSLSSILLILDIKFWSKFSPNHTILVLNWSKIEEFSQFLKIFQLKDVHDHYKYCVYSWQNTLFESIVVL